MSDLKYQSLPQLKDSKTSCEKRISKLKSELGGQQVRLEWINKYIEENTVVELTIEEIERTLGHKIIIKY